MRHLLSLRKVLRPAYNRLLRNRLPLKYAIMGGVVTKGVRFLDIQEKLPKYKEVNIRKLKNRIEQDDVVIEVGSGQGVCTVWAARKASTGKVITFEASKEMYEITKDTIDVNSPMLPEDVQIDVYNEVIGQDVDVWGNSENVTRRSPSDLPEGDVLITDCEGAELDILQDLSFEPRTCIIEAHPNKGVKRESVIDELKSRGYVIESVQPDNPETPFVYIIVGENN